MSLIHLFQNLFRRSHRWARPIAVSALALAYLHANVTGLYAAETDFWNDRRRAAKKQSAQTDFLAQAPGGMPLLPAMAPSALGSTGGGLIKRKVLPDGAETPLGWLPDLVAPHGDLRQVHVAKDPTAPFILHLQDAHEIEQAQRSQAGLIQALRKDRGVTLVGLEGAVGPFSTSAYRALPHPEITRGVAEAMTRLGYIGGAELAALTVAEPLILWGVEDSGLYRDNLAAFGLSERNRAGVEEILKDLWGGSDQAAHRVYSPSLLNFDRHAAAYRARRESLSDYIAFLAGVLPLGTEFPQVALFIKVSQRERSLNLKSVERERKALLEMLVQKLPPSPLQQLVDHSLRHRGGGLSSSEFYRFFRELCAAHGIPLARWPHLAAYLESVELAEEIDGAVLLDELSALEQRVESHLARSPQERTIAAVRRDLSLLDKLVDHALTPAEWRSYSSRREQVLRIPATLSSNLGRPVLPIGRTLAPELLVSYEDFSSKALARNQALVDNLLAKMKTEKASAAVLVAGGFHTDGLTEILRSNGISYAVVSPRLTQAPAEARALGMIVRDPLPLEKLLAGEVIRLASPRITAAQSSFLDTLPTDLSERFRNQFITALKLFPVLHTTVALKQTGQADNRRVWEPLLGKAPALFDYRPLAFSSDPEGRLAGLRAVTGEGSFSVVVAARKDLQLDPTLFDRATRSPALFPQSEESVTVEGVEFIVRFYGGEDVEGVEKDTPIGQWLVTLVKRAKLFLFKTEGEAGASRSMDRLRALPERAIPAMHRALEEMGSGPVGVEAALRAAFEAWETAGFRDIILALRTDIQALSKKTKGDGSPATALDYYLQFLFLKTAQEGLRGVSFDVVGEEDMHLAFQRDPTALDHPERSSIFRLFTADEMTELKQRLNALADSPTADVQLFVDPLYGTAAFLEGWDEFAFVVGALWHGKPIFAAASLPALGVWVDAGPVPGSLRKNGIAVPPDQRDPLAKIGLQTRLFFRGPREDAPRARQAARALLAKAQEFLRPTVLSSEIETAPVLLPRSLPPVALEAVPPLVGATRRVRSTQTGFWDKLEGDDPSMRRWTLRKVRLADGTEVRVAIRRGTHSKPFVLYFPGAGTMVFDPQFNLNGRTVVIVERRPHADGKDLVHQTVEDTSEMLRSLNRDRTISLRRGFHVFGHSLGAHSAMGLVTQGPPEVVSTLRSLTLLNPAAPGSGWGKALIHGIRWSRRVTLAALDRFQRSVTPGGTRPLSSRIRRVERVVQRALLPLVSVLVRLITGEPMSYESGYRYLANLAREIGGLGYFLQSRFQSTLEAVSRSKVPIQILYSPRDPATRGLNKVFSILGASEGQDPRRGVQPGNRFAFALPDVLKAPVQAGKRAGVLPLRMVHSPHLHKATQKPVADRIKVFVDAVDAAPSRRTEKYSQQKGLTRYVDISPTPQGGPRGTLFSDPFGVYSVWTYLIKPVMEMIPKGPASGQGKTSLSPVLEESLREMKKGQWPSWAIGTSRLQGEDPRDLGTLFRKMALNGKPRTAEFLSRNLGDIWFAYQRVKNPKPYPLDGTLPPEPFVGTFKQFLLSIAEKGVWRGMASALVRADMDFNAGMHAENPKFTLAHEAVNDHLAREQVDAIKYAVVTGGWPYRLPYSGTTLLMNGGEPILLRFDIERMPELRVHGMGLEVTSRERDETGAISFNALTQDSKRLVLKKIGLTQFDSKIHGWMDKEWEEVRQEAENVASRRTGSGKEKGFASVPTIVAVAVSSSLSFVAFPAWGMGPAVAAGVTAFLAAGLLVFNPRVLPGVGRANQGGFISGRTIGDESRPDIPSHRLILSPRNVMARALLNRAKARAERERLSGLLGIPSQDVQWGVRAVQELANRHQAGRSLQHGLGDGSLALDDLASVARLASGDLSVPTSKEIQFLLKAFASLGEDEKEKSLPASALAQARSTGMLWAYLTWNRPQIQASLPAEAAFTALWEMMLFWLVPGLVVMGIVPWGWDGNAQLIAALALSIGNGFFILPRFISAHGESDQGAAAKMAKIHWGFYGAATFIGVFSPALALVPLAVGLVIHYRFDLQRMKIKRAMADYEILQTHSMAALGNDWPEELILTLPSVEEEFSQAKRRLEPATLTLRPSDSEKIMGRTVLGNMFLVRPNAQASEIMNALALVGQKYSRGEGISYEPSLAGLAARFTRFSYPDPNTAVLATLAALRQGLGMAGDAISPEVLHAVAMENALAAVEPQPTVDFAVGRPVVEDVTVLFGSNEKLKAKRIEELQRYRDHPKASVLFVSAKGTREEIQAVVDSSFPFLKNKPVIDPARCIEHGIIDGQKLLKLLASRPYRKHFNGTSDPAQIRFELVTDNYDRFIGLSPQNLLALVIVELLGYKVVQPSDIDTQLRALRAALQSA